MYSIRLVFITINKWNNKLNCNLKYILYSWCYAWKIEILTWIQSDDFLVLIFHNNLAKQKLQSLVVLKKFLYDNLQFLIGNYVHGEVELRKWLYYTITWLPSFKKDSKKRRAWITLVYIQLNFRLEFLISLTISTFLLWKENLQFHYFQLDVKCKENLFSPIAIRIKKGRIRRKNKMKEAHRENSINSHSSSCLRLFFPLKMPRIHLPA